MNHIKYKPIGVIRSPFKDLHGTPVQSIFGRDIEGTVEIFPEYAEGLKDIGGFSDIILIYHFHLSTGREMSLNVRPFWDHRTHGVFTTRSPARPNAIGISIVRLTRVEGKRLHIRDVDIVDGTPLLDIKPYVPQFDARETQKTGWLENKMLDLDKHGRRY